MKVQPAAFLRTTLPLAIDLLDHYDSGRYHSIWLPDHMVSFWPDSIWAPEFTDLATASPSPHRHLDGMAVAAAAAVPFVAGAGESAAQAEPAPAGEEYTERYQGRTIRVAAAAAGGGVFIDDQPLHLMKFADDAYLSSMCHYAMAPTPLHAARRAVEELRGAALLPSAHGSHITTV